VDRLLPDLCAPIVPGVSLGGFRLGEHIANHTKLILKTWKDDQRYMRVINPMEVRYTFPGSVAVGVDLLTGRIFKLSARDAYHGSLLGKITVGMPCKQAKENVPKLYFDETHSLLRIPDEEGVCLEVAEEDPLEETVWNSKIDSITIIETTIYQEMRCRQWE